MRNHLHFAVSLPGARHAKLHESTQWSNGCSRKLPDTRGKRRGSLRLLLQRTFLQSSFFYLHGDLCAASFDPACAIAKLKCLNRFDKFMIDDKSTKITFCMPRICEMHAPCAGNAIHNDSVNERRCNNSAPSITLLTWSLCSGNGINSVSGSIAFDSETTVFKMMSLNFPRTIHECMSTINIIHKHLLTR